jgi:bacterioferritin-associated ferredoxin
MLICLCKGVSDKKVRAVIDGGAETTAQIGEACGAGTGCGACVPMLEDMLDARGSQLTAVELVRRVANEASTGGSPCADCPRRQTTLPLVASSS